MKGYKATIYVYGRPYMSWCLEEESKLRNYVEKAEAHLKRIGFEVTKIEYETVEKMV